MAQIENYFKNVQKKVNSMLDLGKEFTYTCIIVDTDGKKDTNLTEETDCKTIASTIKRYIKSMDVKKISISLNDLDGKKIWSFTPYELGSEKGGQHNNYNNSPFAGFSGSDMLGLIEQKASEVAQKRIDEMQKENEFNRLTKENEELKQENEELEEKYDDLYEKYEQIRNTGNIVNGVIQTIKTFPGFTKISENLANLAGAWLGDENNESQKQIADESGIVEEHTPNSGNKDYVTQAREQLMNYIKHSDPEKIKAFFAIMFAVEKDFKNNSELIIAFCREDLKVTDIPNFK